jgi:hypothetical protein
MWIITAWQCISSEVTVRGCKKYCLSNAVVGTDGMLCSDSEGDGNVGVSGRKMNVLECL